MRYSKKEHGEINGGVLKNAIALINYYGQPVIPAGAKVEVMDYMGEVSGWVEDVPLCFIIDYKYKGEMKRKLFMIDSSNLPCDFMTEWQYHKYGDDSLSEIVVVSLEMYLYNIKPYLDEGR